MSRYPFRVLGKTRYGKCNTADCFASKGAVLIELTLRNGRTVQVAATHLQSEFKYESTRVSQINQLKHLLERFARPGIPQVLAGDLNINAESPELAHAASALGMTRTEIVGPILTTSNRHSDCYPTSHEESKWIDHVFVADAFQNPASKLEVVPLDFEHNGKLCPASDHHAVAAELTFKLQ